jgi:TonB family protein
MKFTLLTLLASVAMAGAADKPTVYNQVNAESTDIDPLVKAALEGKFKIVDLREDKEFVPPKGVEGHLPLKTRVASGEWLGGKVLVAYVITAEGRVAQPVVLKTTDERLNAVATKAMEGWRFEPAKLKGTTIATTAAQQFEFETTPTEFVEQVLEPTGGKIPRPKDWHYLEGHRAKTYMWTISREDTKAGEKHYRTGVRIQTFVGVKKATGKSAKEFILNIVAQKKKEADKVVKTCEEKEQGLFTRVCLETEEGPYHILYSLFWGNNDTDIAVMTFSGTTKELWEIYTPVFDKMSAFELIDMKRFEK